MKSLEQEPIFTDYCQSRVELDKVQGQTFAARRKETNKAGAGKERRLRASVGLMPFKSGVLGWSPRVPFKGEPI